MEVKGVALAGGFAPGLDGEGSAGGAADGGAVDGPPGADLAKDLGVGRVDTAVAHGADVHELVAAAGGGFGEEADKVGGGLVGVVVGVVAVGLVGGGNALPVTGVGRELGGLVAGGVVVAEAVDEAAVDDEGRLGGADGGHDSSVFLGRELMRGVEPEDVGIVVADEFLDLGNGFGVHVAAGAGDEVRGGFPPIGAAEEAIAAGVVEVPVVARTVGLAPVEGVRVVETKFEAVESAGVAQLYHRIAGKRRGLDDGGVAHLRVEHGEAVVVFGGDDKVAHAGLLREADPGIGVEVDGVKGAGDLTVIYRDWDLGHSLDMFAVAAVGFALPGAAERRVDAPVDEHAEAGLAPPTETGVALRGSGDQGLVRRGACRLRRRYVPRGMRSG